ncbi:hypothetical protein ACP26L_07680 [Paenibacillus sp. S-38]|uniref:hypothetical protein n=1 Tax=Paenibacillus sp. S-38 TaxID=3416710 RepID=UPI003CF757E7
MNEIINAMDFSTGWWYPVVLGFFCLFFVITMPKRINWREIYLTFGLIAGLVWVVDTVFAIWLDLFDIGDPTKRGIGEFFLYAIIPPCLAVIYLNFYQERNKFLHTLLFTALSGLVEWGAVAVGLMKETHWNTLYSLPVFLAVYYLFLPKHLNILENTTSQQNRWRSS